ncbi:hypothetical protein FG93_05477 [Bosea sp. LC85]|uniref:DUF4376 domain-containing protein n=1 Tax=Bosea sp. LC85 TaxID=1502851 RepID=UPI0004E455F0|nr:DUF4376 domain-containing protein [Bosea sp. LC85]KFC63967.1 hypothetical protein FG93_05477 [Bosea sp. LC85]
MKFARVVGGTIVEFPQPVEGASLAESFHPDFIAALVAVPVDAELGWISNGGTFGPPGPPLPSPVDLVAYAREKRWQIEIGGILVAGVPVATDDRSKIMIVGGRVAAMADAAWSTIWQGADGNAYPVNAAAMIAISDAVQAHVNATFATLATVLSAIESSAVTTKAAIDADFALLTD